MHEASVAKSLVELVCDDLAMRGLTESQRVRAVQVRLGRLGSVVPAALRSAFEVAKRYTPLHEAELRVAIVEPAVWCAACAVERPIAAPYRLRCPTCGQRCAEMVRGQEMELDAIELADAPVEAKRGA